MKIFFSLLFIILTSSHLYAADIRNPAQLSVEQAEEKKKGFWNYVDAYHYYLQSRIDDPVLWFDGFFGEPRTEDEELPVSYIRLRTAARYTEGDAFTFPVRLHVNVRMKNLSDKFRLIITGINEDERTGDREDTSETLQAGDENEQTSLGLRYILYKKLRSQLHFGGGLSLGWPLEYYGRARYERVIHIGSENLIRFTETGVWHSLDGFGETTRFDFERKITDTVSTRLSTFGTYSETSFGVDWGIHLSLYKKYSYRKAQSLDLGMNGVTRPETRVSGYRIGSRFRTNIYRPWLFLEFEPEVSWPLDELYDREALFAVTVRLEVQLAN